MKSDTMGIGNPINQEDLKELLKETKETVATHVRQEDSDRTFGAIDMWNLHKKHRTSINMRRWLN